MMFLVFLSVLAIFSQTFAVSVTRTTSLKAPHQQATEFKRKYGTGPASTITPLMPHFRGASSHRSANATDGETSTYLLYSMFTTNAQCSGLDHAITGGTRFNSCVIGEGSETNPVISYMYTSPSETDKAIYFSMCQYYNTDCSGKAADCEAMNLPKKCLADDSGLTSTNFRLAMDVKTPWSVLEMTGGVVAENFFTKDACTAGSYTGDVFSILPLNTCFSEDGDGPVKSQTFTFCGNGKFAVNQFTDSACSVFANSFAAPFDNCYYSESGAEYEVTTCV